MGRERELSFLDRALGAACATGDLPVLVVEGVGGIGKSALVVEWSHRQAARYPDGQLFADFASARELPGSPVQRVLHGFLLALGVEPRAVPADEQSTAALYRSAVADQSVLVVLENVDENEDVHLALPGTPSCAVIATSRTRPHGLRLRPTAALHLDVLRPGAARELFESRIRASGGGTDAAAVDTLVAACAGLPLALAIVAARVSAHPGFPLSHLAEEFDEAVTDVDAFESDDGSVSLRGVLEWSYTALTAPQARAFRLIGAAPTDEVELPAAVSLLATSHRSARRLLRALESRNLVRQPEPDRFRMHSLVRAWAGALAADAEEPEALVDAVRRWVDFYAHTANAADVLLYPHRSRPPLPAPAESCAPLAFSGEEEAFSWFTTAHGQVLAALDESVRRGWFRIAWHLSRALDTFHYRRGNLAENVRTSHVGVEAARALGDRDMLGTALRQLGRAQTRGGDFAAAADSLREALDLVVEGGDSKEAAHTHHDLSRLCARSGDREGALTHAAEAVRCYRTCGDAVGEAHALNALGRAHAEVGADAEALRLCSEALGLAERTANAGGQMVILDNLASIARRAEDPRAAVDYYERALALAAATGSVAFEAEVAERLGHLLAESRDGSAATALRRARDLYATQQRLAEAARCDAALSRLGTPGTS
ncbi:tetratricopeptide repeat protein [Actinosynnema sp. NPDC053489]|uniref:tetratricopeptide repeat protein n=1 Tax=Actinosynnema sp. NPDC053489 TaxID=3363916 RepID=UPI0037CBEE2F